MSSHSVTRMIPKFSRVNMSFTDSSTKGPECLAKALPQGLQAQRSALGQPVVLNLRLSTRCLTCNMCVCVCVCVCVWDQSCPTLCDLMECSPPVSSVHGIFQARKMEWVANSYSRGSFQPKDQYCSLF